MPQKNSTHIRCDWANTNELFIPYHDVEWGVPEHSDRMLFEMLNLEGAQAGLSWLIVLRKRETYRTAFDMFNPEKIISYDEAKRAELMNNAGIIRNRLKIHAVIENAKAYFVMSEKYDSFDKYIWHYSDSKVLDHADHNAAVLLSETMSKQLKKDGFRFVGPTICYAFMQAIGMINDHEPYCFRYTQIKSR